MTTGHPYGRGTLPRIQADITMKTGPNLIQTCLLVAMLLQATTSGAQPVTKVAAGGWHSLFFKSDGSLWAVGWSYNPKLEFRSGTDFA